MSAALDARGLKRVCVGCGIRFYDMNKRPIKCPNCGNEFSGEIKLKSRRGRAAAVDAEAVKKAEKVQPVANDETQDDVIENSDEISLDEVEDMENAGADDEEDIELDDKDLGDLEEIEALDDEDSEEELEVEVEDKD